MAGAPTSRVIPLCVQPLMPIRRVGEHQTNTLPTGILLLGPDTYTSHPYIIVIQRTVRRELLTAALSLHSPPRTATRISLKEATTQQTILPTHHGDYSFARWPCPHSSSTSTWPMLRQLRAILTKEINACSSTTKYRPFLVQLSISSRFNPSQQTIPSL